MEIKSIEIIKQEFNNGNNGIIYDDINLEDKNKYYWKCSDCDEIWQTSNYQRRIVKKGNCLFCTGQKVRKVESLGFLYPELITEWSSENNKDIYHYSIKYYDKKVKWICKDCNNHYEQRIPLRINGSGCLCKKDTLIKHPDLAKEIQNANPSKITIGTHDKYDWKCQECGNIWKEEVNKRVNGKSKCPKCSKSKAIEGNTLADTHRQLMNEWDFEKNMISPFKITSRNSSEIISWKCEKFPDYHKWDIKLESRVSKKPTGCPYCSGVQTSILESIISDNPDYRNVLLAQEFDKEKNTFKIEELRAKSQKKIWWKCSECKHSWHAMPANRSGINETGCPECSEKIQSIAEKKLRQELKKIFNQIEDKPKNTSIIFSKGKEITVDFFLTEPSLAFDLDPYYTHKHPETYIRDQEKSSILIKYHNFFKLREDPLKMITENDIVYNCSTNNYKELAKLIYKKIMDLYPHIDSKIKSKLLKEINS
jgi:hypothetical protein